MSTEYLVTSSTLYIIKMSTTAIHSLTYIRWIPTPCLPLPLCSRYTMYTCLWCVDYRNVDPLSTLNSSKIPACTASAADSQSAIRQTVTPGECVWFSSMWIRRAPCRDSSTETYRNCRCEIILQAGSPSPFRPTNSVKTQKALAVSSSTHVVQKNCTLVSRL